jgi:hypothetical protein
MTRNGVAYELPMLALPTKEIDGGAFATPNTMDSLPPKSEKALHREMTISRPGRSKPANLRDQVSNMQNWPSPRASEYKDTGPVGSKSYKHMLDRFYLCATAKDPEQPLGMLNPVWVEWLMGWPLAWTESKLWVTVKSRSKRR